MIIFCVLRIYEVFIVVFSSCKRTKKSRSRIRFSDLMFKSKLIAITYLFRFTNKYAKTGNVTSKF